MDSSTKKEAELKQTIKTKNRELARAKQRLRSEVEKNAVVQKQMEERLEFENLLSDISTRFIEVSGEDLDREIRLAQQQVCECLGIDFSGFWKVPGGRAGSLLLIHYYRSLDLPPDNPPPFPEHMDAKEYFPWVTENLLRGKYVSLSRLSDLPAEAVRDLESLKNLTVKSNIVFPLSVRGGKVFAALDFTFFREELGWRIALVSRLKLVAKIFAIAMARDTAENALSLSEEQVGLALDSAEAGAWWMDFKTGIVWVTAKTRDLYGFSADEVITTDTYSKVYHPDDRDRVIRNVHRQFQGHSNFQEEYRIVLPDGRIRWIKAQAKAYYSPSGELERLMGVSFDISQRKQVEGDIAQMRLELAHLSRITMMNEISSSLAHEINQPLGAILNNAATAKLIISRLQDRPEEIKEILEDIIDDTRRAGDVIRKIRGLVKKSDVRFEQLDINSLIRDCVELTHTRISMSKITLSLDLQQGIENVMGDRVYLQQVIINLISNALEAMAGRSPRELTIRTNMTAPDTVTVSVSDSGTGIDDDHKYRLFEPFFTTKDDGLGMGLRICHSIIEEHGGHIWAENNPTEGATVSFSLKALEGEAA